MSQRENLLSVEYHSDDDTGMYQVGEIDFGISGLLDEYLDDYGYKGKKEIVDTLAYLIYEVEKRFREKNPSPAGEAVMHKSSVEVNL